MSVNIRIQKSKLLIVEGKDEYNFFHALIDQLPQQQDIQVLPIGGKTQLHVSLQALVRDPRFPDVISIGIIRDADITPPKSTIPASKSALDSVCDAIQQAGLNPPSGHAVFTQSSPRVGVFVMPDGVEDGMLETLCVSAVESCPEFACVTQYMDCLSQYNISPQPIDKARALVFLASRDKPDKRVGEAAQSGYWPWSAPAFVPLINFVCGL